MVIEIAGVLIAWGETGLKSSYCLYEFLITLGRSFLRIRARTFAGVTSHHEVVLTRDLSGAGEAGNVIPEFGSAYI